MRKKITIASIALLTFTVMAVTVKWYSDTGVAPTLNTNDIFLIERTTPHTNLYASLGQLAQFIQTNITTGGGDQVWTNDGGVVSVIDNTNIDGSKRFSITTNGFISIYNDNFTNEPSSKSIDIKHYVPLTNDVSQQFIFASADSDSSFTGDEASWYLNYVWSGPVCYMTSEYYAQNTNSETTSLTIKCSTYANDEALLLQTNGGNTVFKVDHKGNVLGTAFKNASGAFPPNAGGVTGAFKVVTNGTDTATWYITNGIIMNISAP